MPRRYTHHLRPLAPVVSNADGTVSVPLCARDGSIRAYALVDAEDADFVGRWRWSMYDGYAMRSLSRVPGERRHTIRMHRELMGLIPGDGLEVDHIDRDRLNNRRTNLRAVTRAGNAQNRPIPRNSSSRFRGVTWDKARGKWAAIVGGKHLGRFNTEGEAGEAARAYRAQVMPFATN